MDRVRENEKGVMKAEAFRDMGNRRALRDIKNLAGGPSSHCAATKRGLMDKCELVEKKVSRRPITRRFAAALASKSQANHQDEEPKENSEQIRNGKSRTPIIPLVVSSGSVDSFAVKELDEQKQTDDFPLPMEDEMDSSDKEEMEDIMMETMLDIDGYDRENPLAVVDYVEDIYSFYRKIEDSSCVSPDYMSIQFDINEKMRAILIDWLIEVHYKFELMEETLFLTINIIDRFLTRKTVIRKKLQLVGVTALLLACKYEEVSIPVVEDLILISDRAYTRTEVLEMETLIVNTLQFNMSVPTPYVFMRRFLKAAHSDRKLELLSFFIIELCLVEYKMLKFRPSLLAAAAIYTAQSTLRGSKEWTKTCELHTNYSEEKLLECSMLMVDFHLRAAAGKFSGVHRKYSTLKYGCAAKSEPALFLLKANNFLS